MTNKYPNPADGRAAAWVSASEVVEDEAAEIQEIHTELKQAKARINELEAKLKTARADALKEAADWVDEMRVSSRQQAIEGILGLINKEAE